MEPYTRHSRHNVVGSCAWQTVEAAEEIITACEQAGVQFMDGTMWVTFSFTFCMHF